jgi:hypothetical protein
LSDVGFATVARVTVAVSETSGARAVAAQPTIAGRTGRIRKIAERSASSAIGGIGL